VDKTGFGGRRKLHPEHPVFQCSIFSPSLPLLVDRNGVDFCSNISKLCGHGFYLSYMHHDVVVWFETILKESGLKYIRTTYSSATPSVVLFVLPPNWIIYLFSVCFLQ
jgi:hypothetical protein